MPVGNLLHFPKKRLGRAGRLSERPIDLAMNGLAEAPSRRLLLRGSRLPYKIVFASEAPDSSGTDHARGSIHINEASCSHSSR